MRVTMASKETTMAIVDLVITMVNIVNHHGKYKECLILMSKTPWQGYKSYKNPYTP